MMCEKWLPCVRKRDKLKLAESDWDAKQEQMALSTLKYTAQESTKGKPTGT